MQTFTYYDKRSNKIFGRAVVVHNFNPRTLEAEAGGALGVQDQP